MTATPVLTTPEEWAGLDDCTLCYARAGEVCTNLTNPSSPRHRPHPQRSRRADRRDGSLLLGAAAVDDGDGVAHAAFRGITLCRGVTLPADVVMRPVAEVPVSRRCARPSCRRMWKAEEWR